MLLQRKKRAPRRNANSGGNTGLGATTSVSNLTDNPPASEAPPPQPQSKLHSIGGMLTGRVFTGQFNARGRAYDFVFAPTGASLNGDGKLELTGRFSANATRGGGGVVGGAASANARTMDNVRATLLATQGGIGTQISRRQLLAAGTVQSGNIATPQQKQEEAKAPEMKQGTPEPAAAPASALPVTESTDTLSFVGVMYFRLSPLNASALLLPLDLSAVQLNLRLAPVDDVARDLQFLFSDLIAAAEGAKRDEGAANTYVQELDRVLKGASAARLHRPFDSSAESAIGVQTAALTSTQVHPHFEILEAAE